MKNIPLSELLVKQKNGYFTYLEDPKVIIKKFDFYVQNITLIFIKTKGWKSI